MTPAGITAEATKTKLNVNTINIPTCSVANDAVNTGAKARCFAQYMQIHALEATGGFVYAQIGQSRAKPGTPRVRPDPRTAQPGPRRSPMLDPTTQQPVANGARDVWVTETALTTALNSCYMAAGLGFFAIVVGIALLLCGVGFPCFPQPALPKRRRLPGGLKGPP